MTDNSFLQSSLKLTTYYQGLGLKTINQLVDDELHWTPGEESNSIAIIVRHISGNIFSRFTNFLTEDGEKVWRDRDAEFVDNMLTSEAIVARWNEGWEHLQEVLKSLSPEDLHKTIYIRNEGHNVIEAIQRQLTHYAYHVGQIVSLGKLIRGKDWKCLSIPKNQSTKFNQEKFSKSKEIKHFTDDDQPPP